MRISNSKLSRVLAGNSALSWNDLQALLRALDADADSAAYLNDIWEQIHSGRPAFASWSDILSPAEIEFYEAQQKADIVLLNAIHSFPMLLRTLTYHREMTPYVDRWGEKTGRWMQLLPLAQQRANPDRQLHVIVAEEALLRLASMPSAGEQFERLRSEHEQGTIIQVLPLSEGIMPGLLQPFTIFDWESAPELSLFAASWLHRPVEWINRTEEQLDLREVWSQLVARSSSNTQLPAIIELAQRHRQGSGASIVSS